MRRATIAAVLAALAALPAHAVPVPAGVAGLVTIYNDDFGVPHIVGETPEAMAYGAGYVVGRDRAFETDVIRRLAQGRLSEILGAEMLEADMVMRREFYDADDIAAQVAALPDEVHRLLQAWADGFNTALTAQLANPLEMPALFPALGYVPEPWTPEDSASVLMVFTMVEFAGEGAGGELRNAQLLAELIDENDGDTHAALAVWEDLLLRNDPEAVPVVPLGEEPGQAPFVSSATPHPDQVDLALTPGIVGAAAAEADILQALHGLLGEVPVPRIGSYALAANGSRTSTGRPILMGSPQAGFFAPSLFYEMGLHSPGRDCTGFTVPGLGPWIGIGWCNQHAWTLVAGNAGDQVDLYIETLCDGGYEFEGSCTPFEARTETYVVKSTVPVIDGEPPELDIQQQEILSTVHGPVFHLDQDAGQAFAFKRAQAGAFATSFVALDDLNVSSSFEQIQASVATFTATYNFVYADAAGNIAYYFTGRQPVRAEGADHRLPTPGDGAFEWQAVSLSPEDIPHVVNPSNELILVNQGVDSKPISWWPRASDVYIGRFGHTMADHEFLADEFALDIDRIKELNRELISDRDIMTPLVDDIITGALAGEGGELGDAFALYEAWRDAGYPRVDADEDGMLDDPAIPLFTIDRLNFDRSPVWSTFMANVWSEAGREPRGPAIGRTGHTIAAIQSPELFSRDYGAGWEQDFRDAMTAAIDALSSANEGAPMTEWRAPAPTVGFDPLGLLAPGDMKVVDHGTYSQIVDLGLGVGVNVLPAGNGRADSVLDIANNAATGGFPPHFIDQIELYETFEFKPMKMRASEYTANAEFIDVLVYPPALS